MNSKTSKFLAVGALSFALISGGTSASFADTAPTNSATATAELKAKVKAAKAAVKAAKAEYKTALDSYNGSKKNRTKLYKKAHHAHQKLTVEQKAAVKVIREAFQASMKTAKSTFDVAKDAAVTFEEITAAYSARDAAVAAAAATRDAAITALGIIGPLPKFGPHHGSHRGPKNK